MPEFLTDYFNGLTESFLSTLNTPDAYLNKISLTAVVFIISWLLHMLIQKLIKQNVSDIKKRFRLRRIFKNSMIVLTVIGVLFIWIQAINALILMTLLFGVFIVFMVRGLTNNFIGYFVIKYRNYFKVGHRIEINNIIGDVIEINPVNTKLLEVRNWLSSDANTGRVIKIPNRIIFEELVEMIGVKNTFVWHEIKYVLSFDSDWRDAERIMTEAGNRYFSETLLLQLTERKEHAESEHLNLQPVFSVNTNEDGIVLVLRYLVDYRSGTSTKTALQREMLTKFETNKQIKFATLDIRILPE